MDALARLSDAVAALCEARTIDEVKHIIDIAVAAQEYARRAKLGREAEMYGAEIALRAEHRLGEILRVSEKATGEGGQFAGREPGGAPVRAVEPYDRPKNTAKTLAEYDLSKDLSSRSQRLATIPVAELSASSPGPATRSTCHRVASPRRSCATPAQRSSPPISRGPRQTCPRRHLPLSRRSATFASARAPSCLDRALRQTQ